MDDEEPPEKRANYIDAEDEVLETEYFDSIDPSEPSTSTLPSHTAFQEKFENPQQSIQKNRLRAPRHTSQAIADAAQKNGMQTVNRSGARFVVPISMQAHPTQLNDRIHDEKDDILKQRNAWPYCCLCHSIVKTWRGLEYHVLRIHIKYRAFRCYHCQKESFYTEEEGRFHLSTHHPNDEIMLIKEFDSTKEASARSAFKNIFMICRDGPEVTRERIYEWETSAAQQVMKFQYLRFKRPIVLVKKPPSLQKESQTDLTSVHIMVQPIVNRSGRLYQNVPIEFDHLPARVEYPSERLPGTLRPRSTATQHDEDPRDREKRVAALMHAVTTSRD